MIEKKEKKKNKFVVLNNTLSYKMKDEDKKDGIARQDEKSPPP